MQRILNLSKGLLVAIAYLFIMPISAMIAVIVNLCAIVYCGGKVEFEINIKNRE